MTRSFPLLLRFLLLCTVFAGPAAPAARGADPEPAAQTGPAALSEIPTYVQKRIYKKARSRKEIEMRVRSAAVGDVDGDGLYEVIATDGRRLGIYQWRYGRFRPLREAAPKGKRWFFSFWPGSRQPVDNPLEAVNRENRGLRYLSLEAGDLDGDGRDEILFTGLRDHRLQCGILSYGDEAFTQYLGDPDRYFKILRDPSGGLLLTGVDLGGSRPIPMGYLWNGGTCREQGPLILPKEVDLPFLAGYHAPGPRPTTYVSLDPGGRLRFYGPGLTVVAQGEVPGTLPTSSLRIRVGGTHGTKQRLPMPRRFLTGDWDSDGRDELLVILKRPRINLWGLRPLASREIVADLVLSGEGILPFWETAAVPGEILDQAVGDVNNDGTPELVLFIPGGPLGLGRGTRVLIFDAP